MIEEADTRIEKRKRILIIVRWPVGGINTYLRYVYGDHLFAAYQLVILVPNVEEVKDLHKEMQQENIEIRSAGDGIVGFNKSIWMNLISGHFDIVHSHGFSSGLLAVVPARIMGVKHIVTAHDIFDERQFQGFRGRIKQWTIGCLLSLVDVVQPVSHGAARNLLEFMPVLRKRAESRVVTIINGIDLARFQGNEIRDLHSEFGLDKNVFLIGFMGRFMSQKGFTYLVQAVEKLLRKPEFQGRLKIVAVGSGGFVREEKIWIESLGLKNEVLFLPATSEVAKTLKGMDLLVMPSLWEACSLLAMESLVSGVPVIGTDCIGLGEVLEGSPARVVKPRDVDGLASTIEEHVIDNRRIEFEHYISTACQRYDIKRVINDVVMMYQKILADN